MQVFHRSTNTFARLSIFGGLFVLAAATWAPTGGNVQPWRVIVVREPARKQVLQRLYAEQWTRYVAAHRGLPAAADEATRARGERMLRAGDHLAEQFAAVPIHLVFCFDPQLMAITDAALPRVSVVGGASIYPAVQNLMLAARALGLGTALTTIHRGRQKEVRELLGIPESVETAALIPVGWPRGKFGSGFRKPVEDVTYWESWGTKKTNE